MIQDVGHEEERVGGKAWEDATPAATGDKLESLGQVWTVVWGVRRMGLVEWLG